MPIRNRLRDGETIQDYTLAVPQRYLEGLQLMVEGYPGAGIYLMGYAAEMLLKLAYFLYTGAGPADAVGPRLGPARHQARALGIQVLDEGYHSPRFWARLLLEQRRNDGLPLNNELEARLLNCADSLYSNWWVQMRYQPDVAREDEVAVFHQEVDWLQGNLESLWR
jgi:hypothetical protein